MSIILLQRHFKLLSAYPTMTLLVEGEAARASRLMGEADAP